MPSPTKAFTKKTITATQSSSLSLYLLTFSIAILLLLLQLHALSLSHPLRRLRLRPPPLFLPLKDLRHADTPMDGNTWFLSSLNDTRGEDGEGEHLLFPSPPYGNRLLCLSGDDIHNGTNNYYALAPPHSLPPDADLLPGLTFVSDTYYDYENPFHSLSAVAPFVGWHGRRGCVRPARWVLYHRGELRTGMGSWVRNLLEASFGEEARLEGFEGRGGRPSCFEEAVVFRHNEGGMARERKEEAYGMMRCRARERCGVGRREAGEEETAVRLTLLLRTGARAFRDEAAVVRIFREQCDKVEGCRIKVTRPNNLTFCDQVKLMSSTDILASPHGGQMTNLIFMDKNSTVMEFFPKGWLEFAGVGQYVFQAISSWSGMRYKGPWRDPNYSEPCPYGDHAKCWPLYKGGKIGHNETYLATWTAEVLNEMRDYKLSEEFRSQQKQRSRACPCS